MITTGTAATAAGILVLGLAAGTWIGWDWRDARAGRELAKALQEQHDDEVAIRTRIEETAERARDEIVRLRIDRAAADDAGGRFRVRIAALVAAGRAAAASGSAPAAGDGDPIGVLAGVLERSDATAADLADYADRTRAAGEACVRSYEAVTRR